MRITVHFMAQLKKAAGVGSRDVEVDAPATVADLLAKLTSLFGEPLRGLLVDDLGRSQRALLIFVGNDQVVLPEERLLRDADEVTILTPMAGG